MTRAWNSGESKSKTASSIRKVKLPLVDQPPNHQRGLLPKLNSPVSFVRVLNLDPKPDHYDLSRVRLSRQAPSFPR
ncbi:hypothetical protein TB2_028441 [Malus domestica]